MEDLQITAVNVVSSTSHLPRWSTIAEETVVKALEIITNKSNYPILITCKHGRALTGAVVGCLRKIQKWSMVSIFEEYRRYARTRNEQQHEQFIE
jgi:tyrosine-protein phosphatase OCA1